MPLYDARCATCGNVEEVFRSYEERDANLPECCGAPMARTFMPPQVMRDIDGYQSTIDGSWIASRSQHREHLKRHGMREMGNDKPDFSKRGPAVSRDGIRKELRNTVEQMKAQGTFRER
jgi:hypothetical protein